MKKIFLLSFLVSGVLSAQPTHVTVVGRVVVTPELSIATFSADLNEPMGKPRPGYDSGSGYLISPRQFIRNIPRTRGRYGMIIQYNKELDKERSLESQAFLSDFGEIFFRKTRWARQLYFWGLGGNALSPVFDLPWTFRYRISVPANATHIYVGTFIFKRNRMNDIVGFEVRDEFDQAVAELREREPDARLVRADLLTFE